MAIYFQLDRNVRIILYNFVEEASISYLHIFKTDIVSKEVGTEFVGHMPNLKELFIPLIIEIIITLLTRLFCITIFKHNKCNNWLKFCFRWNCPIRSNATRHIVMITTNVIAGFIKRNWSKYLDDNKLDV